MTGALFAALGVGALFVLAAKRADASPPEGFVPLDPGVTYRGDVVLQGYSLIDAWQRVGKIFPAGTSFEPISETEEPSGTRLVFTFIVPRAALLPEQVEGGAIYFVPPSFERAG